MRSHPATHMPVVQRAFWGSVATLGLCLGAIGCHGQDVPAQSPSDITEEQPTKWSGGSGPAKNAPADEGPETKKGKFDEEQANVVLARAAKNAHQCTEVAQKGDFQGTTEVTVTFSGIGRSTKATLGDLDEKQIGQCVIRAFVGMIIPPFEGGDMEMKYPVDLKADAKVPKASDKIAKPPPPPAEKPAPKTSKKSK